MIDSKIPVYGATPQGVICIMTGYNPSDDFVTFKTLRTRFYRSEEDWNNYPTEFWHSQNENCPFMVVLSAFMYGNKVPLETWENQYAPKYMNKIDNQTLIYSSTQKYNTNG